MQCLAVVGEHEAALAVDSKHCILEVVGMMGIPALRNSISYIYRQSRSATIGRPATSVQGCASPYLLSELVAQDE